MAYAATTAVILVLAVNYANNLVYGLCFLLFGLGLIALLTGYRNFGRASLRFLEAKPVFAGQTIGFRLALAMSSARDSWGLTLSSPEHGSASALHVAAGREMEVTLPVPSRQRGSVELGRLRLSSRFPLGLVEFRQDLPELPSAPACLVYPALEGVKALPDPRASTGFQATAEASDPAGARTYASGDPLSWIDWKASARSSGLMTREFDGGERLPALWLDFDGISGRGPEARLSQLCTWIVEAQRQGLKFGLALPGFRSPVAAGPRHAARCLRALALHGPPADA